MFSPIRALVFCVVLVRGAAFPSDQVKAQIDKVDGYDGYRFGMTLDQAKKIKPAAKQTPCDFVQVVACLEYAITISAFPATVTVQFEGATPALSQIIIPSNRFQVPPFATRVETSEERS